MADQEVALQVRAPAVNFDPASQLSAAQNFETGQTQLARLNRVNQSEDIQYRNQLIRDAAAHALDADSWDTAMRTAAQKGAPEAAQYVGRYTPLLQQRVFDAHAVAPAQGAPGALGSPNGASPGGQNTETLDRMYQSATPAQMTQILGKNNAILTALSTVKDEQTYNAAIAQLGKIIPNAQQIAGPWSPMNVVRLWNGAQQQASYLQNRLAAAATGAPNPSIMPGKIEKVGSEYGQDVYGVVDPAVPGGIRRIDPANLPTGTQAPQGPSAGISIPDAMARVRGRENASGNSAATNPRSTAMGNSQFIESTWLDMFPKVHPELAGMLNKQQILALRSNPKIDKEVGEAYAEENAAALSRAGAPVTTATIALAHNFGPEGALKIMSAAPDTPIEKIFPPIPVPGGKSIENPVIKANPDLKGQTSATLAQRIKGQVGEFPINVGGVSATSAASAVAPAAALSAAEKADLHGEDFLKTLPAAQAAQVRQVAEGRSPYPGGGFGGNSSQWLKNAVAQFEPGFTAQTYQQRQKAYNDWYGGGKKQDSIGALDQALNHALGLAASVDKLGNWPWGELVNTSINELQSKTGAATGYNPLKTNAHAVAVELGKTWKGAGNLSDTEIKHWEDTFRINGSIPQQKEDVAKLLELTNGAIEKLVDQHKDSFGQLAEGLPPVISPKIQAKLQALDDWANDRKPASASAPATNVDPRDAEGLRANSHNPAWAAAIDKKYGSGTSAKLLGGTP